MHGTSPWLYVFASVFYPPPRTENTFFQIFNYQHLVNEAARVLRSGGMFLSGEWDPFPKIDNIPANVDMSSATYTLINLANQTLHQRYGIMPCAPLVPDWLQRSGRFANITRQEHEVAIGDWHADPRMRLLGNDFKVAVVRYGDSLKPMLLEAGHEEAFIDSILGEFLREVNERRMAWVYRTVHARKI